MSEAHREHGRITIYGWNSQWSKPTPFSFFAISHVSLSISKVHGQAIEQAGNYLSFWPVGSFLNPFCQEGTFNYGYEKEQTTIINGHRRFADVTVMAIQRGVRPPAKDATPASYPACHADWVFESDDVDHQTIERVRTSIAGQVLPSSRPWYHVLLRNCSTLIVDVLEDSGLLPKKRANCRHVFWTPSRICKLCEWLVQTEKWRRVL